MSLNVENNNIEENGLQNARRYKMRVLLLITHMEKIVVTLQLFAERITEIMEEKGIEDVSRVGLYGLTFKEDVDDYRDSPTLQLLEAQRKHLGQPLKVYDPWIEHDLVKNQYHDLDEFLNDVDLVVIVVKHNEIKENMDKLAGKVVLDCHNICKQEGIYKI